MDGPEDVIRYGTRRQLTGGVLDVVAAQINALLRGVFNPDRLAGAQIAMGLTLEVWVLEADATIIQPTDDLKQLARPAACWHHQVVINGVTESYARSTPFGAEPKSWRVVEIFESQLAERIDRAMGWVIENVPDDPLVRLLIVPAYELHAFWLITEAEVEQVFVIDCPAQFTNLRSDQLFESQNRFLEALRREPHIVGRIRS